MAKSETPRRNHAHADLLIHGDESNHGRTDLPPTDGALRLGLIYWLQSEELTETTELGKGVLPHLLIARMWSHSGLTGKQRIVDSIAELFEEFAEAPKSWMHLYGDFAATELLLTGQNLRLNDRAHGATSPELGDVMYVNDEQQGRLMDAALKIADPRKWACEQPTTDQRANAILMLGVLGASLSEDFCSRATRDIGPRDIADIGLDITQPPES